MSATPDSTLADPQQIIADLQRQLAECRAERDEALAERDKAQQRLAERTAERDEALEQQTATAEVLQVINSSPGDLGPVFDAILEKAHTLCGATHGALMTFDGETARAVAMRGVPKPFAEFLREGFSIWPGSPPEKLVRGELFVHIPDVLAVVAEGSSELARSLTQAAEGGTRTILFVPLRKDTALIGYITATRLEVLPFTEKQIALLQNFAAQAVIAMENARLITETREALEQQTATAEVLQVINSSPGDLAPVFDAMVEKATRLCDADAGIVRTFDGRLFHLAAASGEPQTIERLRQLGPVRPLGSFAPFTRGERVVQIADVLADSTLPEGDEFSERRRLLGYRTWLGIALQREGQLVGVIIVYRKQVQPFSDAQIALLQNFAAQAVIAMENARLITETREALEQQTATAEVLQVINASPGELAPVFDAMVEKAMRLCDAALGSLFTLADGALHQVAIHGTPELVALRRQEGPLRPQPGTPFYPLLIGEHVVHFTDLRESPAYRDFPAVRERVDAANARSFLAVALRKDEGLIGVLNVFRQEVCPFTDKEIALLQNFAAQAVIAMENARLITETREALEQQTATAEVLGVINSSPGDLAPVFDAILEKAHSLCDVTRGSLQLYDGGKFRAVAMHNLPQALADRLKEGYTPHNTPSWPLLEGVPFTHVADNAARADPLVTPLLRDSGTRLFVALRKDGRLLGQIVAARQEVRPFTDKQIALLQNFAAQAVIAMENARLLSELHQRTDEVAELNRGLEARVAEQVDELGRVGRLKRFLAPQLAELIVSQGDEKILESHRREIVVVFCDLRGYTAFTETAEPEEVLDFLREYHGALGPLVSQFEGTLDQFSGDGIMVFFNDPVPCPDPAERAVTMAVAMRSAANTLIADWRERGRDLGFGAGIAQGYATLGQIGFSERSGYTAIGTVCNIAARLCAEAKDGQILLGQRVNVALKGSVATEQLGALTLKGLTQPVVAYNVPLGAIQPALRVIEGGSPQTV